MAVGHAVDAALADVRELGDGDRREVESDGDRLTMEVSAAHDAAGLGEDERIVGDAVDLDLEDATGLGERVP